jgi:peptide/nickel transport system substrate-binding protein
VRHGGERFANYWRATRCGHADQIEIIVINDATARTAALQGGQVNMINRVEPKIVDLIKRVPGVTIRNVRAAATTSSSCIATPPPSTTMTCGWR